MVLNFISLLRTLPISRTGYSFNFLFLEEERCNSGVLVENKFGAACNGNSKYLALAIIMS